MSSDENDKALPKGTAIRSALDLQRMKLEKLMKNPDKPAFIPERPKDKRFQDAPEFVRNVMGSSAGAGSGEFHVYRHIRRREYARQEFLQQRKDKLLLEEEYHQKLEENKIKTDAKAAKKRAKRQKRKEAMRAKRQKGKQGTKPKESSSSESDSDSKEEVTPLTDDAISSAKSGVSHRESDSSLVDKSPQKCSSELTSNRLRDYANCPKTKPKQVPLISSHSEER